MMKIRIGEAGEIVGWTGPDDQRILSAEDAAKHVAEIAVERQKIVEMEDIPWRVKILFDSLVDVLNAKLGKAQEITATELKAAIGAKLSAVTAVKPEGKAE